MGTASNQRIFSIDILRGIVMVIMALDHVRDFWSPNTFAPEDLTQTTPFWFFTRWITHFCAPIFVFLAGTSAFLFGNKYKDKKALTKFLLSRGIWLIFVELVIVNWSWTFTNPFTGAFHFVQVIWAIGWAMIFLAGLIWLPWYGILGISFIIIFGHNALDGISSGSLVSYGFLWKILHEGFSMITWGQSNALLVAYPLIPWIGVLSAGYVFGEIFILNTERRFKILKQTGWAIIIGFVVLRFTNLYGDSAIWSVQERGWVYTALSFLNTTKYPPSLLYLGMTLGPGILALAYLEQWQGKVAEFFRLFGRVPFFYYVIHFPIIHLTANCWNYINYGIFGNFALSGPPAFPKNYTANLWLTYIVWILLIPVLYFASKWFSNYKKSNNSWWLKYL